MYRGVAGVLLFLLTVGTVLTLAQAIPVVLEDEHVGHMDPRDFKSFEVWDNGTHLLLEWDWWGLQPSGEPWYLRDALVYLDIDNNRYTGLLRGWLSDPSAGAEVEVHVYPEGDVDVYIWGADDSYIGWEPHPEWVVLQNETSYIVAIPLDWLNLTAGDTLAALCPWTYTKSWDWVWFSVVNWTVPAAGIVVDGGDADWAGVPAFAADNASSSDQYSLEEQYANITEAYVAANGTHLFLAFRMGGPLNPAINNYNWWDLYYNFYVDADNNGTWDYNVQIYTDKMMQNIRLDVENYTSGLTFQYWLGDPRFPLFSGLDTGFVELAIDPSILGLPADMRNQNITLNMRLVILYVEDWAELGSRIVYTIGSGGYAAVPADWEYYELDTGVYEVVFGDLNLTVNVSGGTRLYLWVYGVEPTGNASLGYDALTGYYVLWFQDPGAVGWPVHVEVNVSGARGVPVLMYYNKTAGAYMEVADQSYDPAAGILSANIAYEEYTAGDEPVLVVADKPATVGASLELPTRKTGTPNPLTAAAITLLALATATIITQKHRKH